MQNDETLLNIKFVEQVVVETNFCNEFSQASLLASRLPLRCVHFALTCSD